MPVRFACALASVVVAVDVGKRSAALSVTDNGRVRLLGPVEFAMTRPSLQATVDRISQVLAAGSTVRVGVEAAGTIICRCCRRWCGRLVGSWWR